MTMNKIHTAEHAYSMFGIEGRMHNKLLNTKTGLFAYQKFGASRPFNEKGFKKGSIISVAVRFDDQCGNKHQSFSITGDVREPRSHDTSIGGCIHDEIEKYFPEIKHLIKWHCTSTNGPMHYAANTAYHASNRDHNGCLKGEPWAWDYHIKFGAFPITKQVGKKFKEFIETKMPSHEGFVLKEVPYTSADGKVYESQYTFEGFETTWGGAPLKSKAAADQFLEALTNYDVTFTSIPSQFGEGKVRDLDAARRCAVWPEATDEQLMLPKAELIALLNERAPKLLEEFRKDVEAAGFLWEQTPGVEA
jgi:hypothetical protein